MEIMNQSITFNRLLHICQKDELLYANDERSIVIPTNAFGVLQRDLIENIGINRMKTFFFKYGWHLGKEDAVEIAKNQSLTMAEKIEYGPILHALKGHAKSRITENYIDEEDNQIKRLRYKGIWENSFEALQHIQNFGLAEYPVCYTLTGYASGYVSAIIGEEVFFKELQCTGEGALCCVWEGRLLSEWSEEADLFFYYSKELPVIKELEQTNEKLLIEKNNLFLVTKIHTDLTSELIKGHNLDSILELVNKQTNLPIVIEDFHNQVIALTGITQEQYDPIKESFHDFLKENQNIQKTRILQLEKGTRIVTPIFLLDKIIGYCSFLYENNGISNYEIDSMIIEKLASTCSLQFLKEKTELESMERIKGHFLEEILSGKYSSKQEIMRKADYIHLDLSAHYHIIFLTYNFTVKCEKKEFTLNKNTFEAVSNYFNEKSINVLIGQQPDSLVILITEKELNKQNIENVTRSLVFFLKKEVKNALFFAGISSLNSKIVDAGAALEEARSAVRLSSREEPITSFRQLGMIGVLINEQNENALRRMIRDTLGVLYEKLDSNKIELIETLYHYLDNGGNLELTSDNLALSISGLRYRLNKITDILGHDLRDPHVRFQLLMALKALKIIDHELLAAKRKQL